MEQWLFDDEAKILWLSGTRKETFAPNFFFDLRWTYRGRRERGLENTTLHALRTRAVAMRDVETDARIDRTRGRDEADGCPEYLKCVVCLGEDACCCCFFPPPLFNIMILKYLL